MEEMEGQDARLRGQKLVMQIQGGILEWAKAEGRADGIAACEALLAAFYQPGTTRFDPEFQMFVKVFERAAAALHAAESEKLREVQAAAVAFREAIQDSRNLESHLRAPYRALDKLLNGSVPEDAGEGNGAAAAAGMAARPNGSKAAAGG